MLRRLICAAAAFAGIGFVGQYTASAAPILPNVWYEFHFEGVGGPLTACTACTCTPSFNPPDGNPVVFAPDSPCSITTAGSADLFVQDLFLSVDQFDIHDFATDLGNTSFPGEVSPHFCGADISVCIADPFFSRRDYTLLAGAHSFTGTHDIGVSGPA